MHFTIYWLKYTGVAKNLHLRKLEYAEISIFYCNISDNSQVMFCDEAKFMNFLIHPEMS